MYTYTYYLYIYKYTCTCTHMYIYIRANTRPYRNSQSYHAPLAKQPNMACLVLDFVDDSLIKYVYTYI